MFACRNDSCTLADGRIVLHRTRRGLRAKRRRSGLEVKRGRVRSPFKAGRRRLSQRSAVNENSRRPEGRRLSDASGDDVSVDTRFVGVGGDGLVGFEVQIALDRKPEIAANGAKSARLT